MADDLWVITFPSVAHAFRAEKVLTQTGVAVRLIPIPRALSGSCEGLAAQVDESEAARAADILDSRGVSMLQRGVRAPGKY